MGIYLRPLLGAACPCARKSSQLLINTDNANQQADFHFNKNTNPGMVFMWEPYIASGGLQLRAGGVLFEVIDFRGGGNNS